MNPDPAASASAASSLTLEEIADRIDPGAQTPLSDGLPPWTFQLIGLEANPTASPEELLKQSAAEHEFDPRMHEESEDGAGMVLIIRSAARSVVLAEQAAQGGASSGDALARLERAYQAVDMPMLASDRSTFGQILTLFAAEAEADSAQLNQLAGVVQGAMRAAGPLHRRTVAQLLRVAPEHDAVPTALLAAATAERGAGLDWTIPAAKLALERRGTLASADEHLDLARVCFAGLDVPCGDAALAAAGGAEEIEEVQREAALARRIVELEGASTLESRLERARAMLELERYALAKAEFEALRVEFPEDARPVGGLALHIVQTEFDFAGAHRLLDAETSLKNGDAEYYQMAIGTRATAVLSTIVPSLAADNGPDPVATLRPLAERMRADIDGYAALGSSDARFLGVVLDIGEELLARYEKTGSAKFRDLTSLSDRVLELQAAIPENPHAYRLLMSAALFETSKSRAATMAGVKAPAGPERDVLVLRRARALTDLAVMWSDAEFAKKAREALGEVDATSSTEAAELHADALMVQRVLGGPSTWTMVGEAYASVLDDDDMTPGDARALNNVALAVMNNSGLPTATQAWTLSSQLAEDHGDVPKLNLIVSATPDGDAAALAAMNVIAGETKLAGVRVTALAWVHAWSKGKAQRDAKAALELAVAEAAKNSPRATAPDPYAGLVFEGALQAGLGYAVDSGLQIELDGSGLPWAILAPPRTP